MKNFIYIIIAIAAGLLIYNATLIDYGNIFEGSSKTALIGVIAPACVILLMLILLTAKAIEKKQK